MMEAHLKHLEYFPSVLIFAIETDQILLDISEDGNWLKPTKLLIMHCNHPEAICDVDDR